MNPESVDLVIYHEGCSDGFGGAFAAWKKLGNRAEYFGAKHGELPPDVTGRTVVCVDFAYKNAVVKQMISQAKQLLILDHHKTAMVDLHDVKETRFDMTKSGAILSWEFFHPGEEPPKFLRYIQDRDLNRFDLPYSAEFSASFDMVPFDFEAYDSFCDDSVFDTAVERGSPILAYKRLVVSKIAGRGDKRVIKGVDVAVANSMHWMNEVGNRLAKEAAVGLVWYYDHVRRIYQVSLRADCDDVDVEEIAKAFGGGGHRGASAFTYRGTSIEEIFDT